MPTSSGTNQGSANAWHAHGAAGWLTLAAAPTFALMAWIAANHALPTAFCSSTMQPMHSMTAMYLLMSLFHLAPWLKLASGRP